jgi:hypothetical protein
VTVATFYPLFDGLFERLSCHSDICRRIFIAYDQKIRIMGLLDELAKRFANRPICLFCKTNKDAAINLASRCVGSESA